MLAKKKRSLNAHHISAASDDAAAKDAKKKKSIFGIDLNPRFTQRA